MDEKDKLIEELRDKVDALQSELSHTEQRRVMARRVSTLELNKLRKAREKGRLANRNLRQKLTELEAKIYRLTNRGDVYDKVGGQYGLSGSKTSRIRSSDQALNALRKAREKGRRASCNLRQKLIELEARLYRLTNRT